MKNTFRLLHGDIAELEVDAVVNAWNRNFIPHWLLIPQGVSRALKRKGGTSIFAQVRRKGMLDVGEAVVTGAGELSARWVIHVAALHAYWRASPGSVRRGAENAFVVAAELGARRVAIPLLGAGTGGLSPRRSLELIRAAWKETPVQPEETIIVIYEARIYDELSTEP